jgi:hypothetical protein
VAPILLKEKTANMPYHRVDWEWKKPKKLSGTAKKEAMKRKYAEQVRNTWGK